MSMNTEELLRQIASDNSSGAAEILQRAAALFQALALDKLEGRALDLESARRLVLETCAALVEAQPEMAPLANLASRVAASLIAPSRAEEIFEAAQHSATDFIRETAQAIAQATARAAALIGDGATVLTHSRSSTVAAAFTEAFKAGRRFSVIATESRPLFEGRKLSESLARQGVRVTVIADANAAAAMSRASLVLLGADRVTPDVVINKIGTRLIALAARERGVPIFALADTSKLASAPAPPSRMKSAEEIWPGAPSGVEALNYYFEPTPIDYFTAIITESGRLSPAEASRRAQSQSLHPSVKALID